MRTVIRVLLLASFVIALATPALAQGEDRAFSVQNFLWAPGHDNYLTLEGASVPKDLRFRLGGMLSYQYRPLHLRECDRVEEDRCTEWASEKTALIKHQLGLEIISAFSFKQVFEVGLALPVVLYQAGDDLEPAGGYAGVESPNQTTGLGDMRLHMKLDILHGIFGYEGERFGLALAPVITFPTGNAAVADAFMGHSSMSVHPKLAFDVRFDRFRLGLNAGYLWREEQQFYLAEVGQRITYGVGGEVTFTDQWSLIAEAFGSNGFTPDVTSAPLEADVAARYRATPEIALVGGIGAGIIAGVGTPLLRAFFGVVWSPTIGSDEDNDGILDTDDRCPEEAEDRDGFEDLDGCPDPDNDQDGFLDEDDNCPDDPEDKDGFEDDDGCPDPDNDMDGIPDTADKCPTEKEVLNGVDDEDGCPDEGEELVAINADQIVILERIHFSYDSHEVDQKSYRVLDIVATVLKANPKMKMRIEGHTDYKGGKRYNLSLSRKRARAVKAYLVKKGIEPRRLVARGYGQSQPIETNKTRRGRAANRRVEFYITRGHKRRN